MVRNDLLHPLCSHFLTYLCLVFVIFMLCSNFKCLFVLILCPFVIILRFEFYGFQNKKLVPTHDRSGTLR